MVRKCQCTKEDSQAHVAVQGHLADLPQGEVCVRPDFGHIEDIPPVILGLGWIHDLNKDIPRRKVLSLDGLKHITNHVVRVLTGNFSCFFPSEVLDTLPGLHVDLDVLERAILMQS